MEVCTAARVCPWVEYFLLHVSTVINQTDVYEVSAFPNASRPAGSLIDINQKMDPGHGGAVFVNTPLRLLPGAVKKDGRKI